MFFRYGSYQHASGEVALASIRKLPAYATSGFRVGTRVLWTIEGALHAANAAALTTAINLLEAYYVPGPFDAGLFEDSGAATAHYIPAGSTLGGWKTEILYPDGRGAEYALYRKYSINLECTLNEAESQLMEFQERYEYGGGGPKHAVLETLYESAVRQQTVASAKWTASQTGSALGWLARPTPPPALFPNALVESPRIVRESPRSFNRGRPTEWPVSWSYQFESPTPLIGEPNATLR